MAQSPEYPDLPWVPPKSWTVGRPSLPRVIVIHTTEGSEHGQSAEDGAAYNQRRTDGTSAHYFVDANSVVHCVRTRDQAHTARRTGNRIGIQYELCGRAGQSDAQWDDANSTATLRLAAKQAARDARKYNIPVVKLTVAQLRAGGRGFVGHVDCTYAFPEDNGTHTDPGPRFPWAEFLALVRAELAPKEEADMDQTQDARLKNVEIYGNAAVTGRDAVGLFNGTTTVTIPNTVARKLDAVLEAIARVDDDVAAALRVDFEELDAAADAHQAALLDVGREVSEVSGETVAALLDRTPDDAADALIAVLGVERAAELAQVLAEKAV
jgi:N-acetyl-anhydromuramyl-L-alanine amidase AmpD